MNTIGILMDRTEGALQRIIGLVERRGFVVAGVTMQAGTGTVAYLAMDLRARDDSRNIDILVRQIARLVDVRRVAAGSHAIALDPAISAIGEPSSATAPRASSGHSSASMGAMP